MSKYRTWGQRSKNVLSLFLREHAEIVADVRNERMILVGARKGQEGEESKKGEKEEME